MELTNKQRMQMLNKISVLVETDFTADMDYKSYVFKKLGEPAWSPEESNKMAEILNSIYKVAHCIHCQSCLPEVLLEFDSPTSV